MSYMDKAYLRTTQRNKASPVYIIPGMICTSTTKVLYTEFYKHILINIKEWISNYIHNFIWDVIIHPVTNFNDGVTKPPFETGHEWIIIHIYLTFEVINYSCTSPDAGLDNIC